MQFIDDWKRQFPKLWSVRLSLLAGLAGAVESGYQIYLTGQPPLIALSATLLSLAAAIARIIAQPSLNTTSTEPEGE
jgi:hypothetical protein